VKIDPTCGGLRGHSRIIMMLRIVDITTKFCMIANRAKVHHKIWNFGWRRMAFSTRAWIITTKQTFIMISMVHAWDPLQEIKIETVNSFIEMWKQFVLSNYRHSSSGLKVRFSCATVVLTSCFDQIEKLEHVAQFNFSIVNIQIWCVFILLVVLQR
jgi:hypothetical protein